MRILKTKLGFTFSATCNVGIFQIQWDYWIYHHLAYCIYHGEDTVQVNILPNIRIIMFYYIQIFNFCQASPHLESLLSSVLWGGPHCKLNKLKTSPKESVEHIICLQMKIPKRLSLLYDIFYNLILSWILNLCTYKERTIFLDLIMSKTHLRNSTMVLDNVPMMMTQRGAGCLVLAALEVLPLSRCWDWLDSTGTGSGQSPAPWGNLTVSSVGIIFTMK